MEKVKGGRAAGGKKICEDVESSRVSHFRLKGKGKKKKEAPAGRMT